MFNNCISLTSLNLSNFETSENIVTYNMFSNCSNLEYLNIKNFYCNEFSENYKDMFIGTKINLVFCINKTNIDKIWSQIYTRECMTIDCSEEWRKNRKKINEENNPNSCVDNCKGDMKYEFNGKCINECPNNDTKMIFNENEFFCGTICPEENPFLIIYEDKCVKNCDINNINKTCFLTYNGNNSENLLQNYNP